MVMDEEASKIAEFLGVRTKGIRFILLNSVTDGLIDKGESIAIFLQMLEGGFWLAPYTALEFEKMLLRM